jgi:ribosomal protein S18 acetylase RimI-like enzyme
VSKKPSLLSALCASHDGDFMDARFRGMRMNSTTEKVEIRRLRTVDAKSYRAMLIEALIVHSDCFSSHYKEELSRSFWEVEKELESNGSFGASLGEFLIGIGSIVQCHEMKRRHCGRMQNLYVREEFRRKGIGGLLVQEILQYSIGDVDQLEVEVPAPCEGVLRLFEQFGFRMCGLVPNGLRVEQQGIDLWTMNRQIR